MGKNLYIDASHPDETRIVLKSENYIEEYEYENKNKLYLKNNIYLGKVSRIEPSLQAAFVNYGRQRHGFLAFNDIQSDYYQIPYDDKDKLKKEEENLRLELKEKNHNAEEVEKIQDKIPDTTSTNNNNNEININDDKNKDENSPAERNSQLNELKKRYGIKRYKIQEVIKPDQIILVQILKDEKRQKGAALTTFISLAGKYSVLMPNTPKAGGISRKIISSDDRKKIRSIIQEIKIPETMGLIIRTAGLNKTKNEVNKDVLNTIAEWEKIKARAVKSIAPSIVYEEGDIIKRAIRDVYTNEIKNIIVDGNEGYQKAKNFMKFFMPENVKKIKKYRGKIPLFHEAGIEKSLNRIFEPTVKLASGGYMVINPTEALVSIDVNSGKSIKQKNVESTALDTNLEAAEEIARQIKIRDLSGLIIIDFIDMLSYGNKRLVERKIKEKCRTDRARIQIGRISNFGLLEMSRQRLRESSVKWQVSLTDESFSLKVLKLIEVKSILNKAKYVKLKICEKVSNFMKENFIEDLKYFENKNKIKIDIIADNSLVIPEYIIDFQNKGKKTIEKIEFTTKLKNLEDLEKEVKNNNSNKLVNKINFKKNNFSKKKFYKKKYFKKTKQAL